MVQYFRVKAGVGMKQSVILSPGSRSGKGFNLATRLSQVNDGVYYIQRIKYVG